MALAGHRSWILSKIEPAPKRRRVVAHELGEPDSFHYNNKNRKESIHEENGMLDDGSALPYNQEFTPPDPQICPGL